jgi:8-oxo-dGTP diphosphatase
MGKQEQGLDGGRGRYQLVPRTLCLISHGDEVLLLKGAPAKRLWPGRYNGVGGHVEPGEDIATAARREINEETGITIRDLRLCGVVTIDVEPLLGIGLYVFSAEAESREVVPSIEGKLTWFPSDALPPREEMVEDLPTLLGTVLSRSPTTPPFCAHYSYTAEGERVIRFSS